MSYSDDTAAFMFSGLDEETETVVRRIIHNDGMSADELAAQVAEYEEEWANVLITERRDLAGAFKTAYMVELRGGGSDGERREATKPTPQSDARRSHCKHEPPFYCCGVQTATGCLCCDERRDARRSQRLGRLV